MHTGTLRACRCHLRQKQGQSRTSTQRSRARAALFASVLRPSCALPANVSIGSTVAQADRPQVPNMTASKADSAPHDVQPGFTGHAENVPATLSDALKLFVRHPSVISAVAIISTALATRLGHPIGFADIAGECASPLTRIQPSAAICSNHRVRGGRADVRSGSRAGQI